MTQAIARLKATAADDMLIETCNQKTAELLLSLNTNVARVFRLEKEHTMVFGPRHTCAYGDWYHTKKQTDLDQAIVDKTVKFLNRMFTFQKHLGKRTAQMSEWYFESNDPNLLVCAHVSKKKSYSGYLGMGPNSMVPVYMEVYYVARSYLSLPPDHRMR